MKSAEGLPKGMLEREALGLKELERGEELLIPKVYFVDADFLILDFVEPGNPDPEFFYRFGKALAKLHQLTSEEFGFSEDNYIGLTPQINKFHSRWDEFYWTQRLEYQFKLAEKNGYITKEHRSLIANLEKKISKIMGDSLEKPSLLHGDLWSGNYIVAKNNRACLIDPAVYYGHREADLAMTRLFGGFPADFYKGYQETFPLKEGYSYREPLYKLYHVLNHLNLFGKSYLDGVVNILKAF